MTPRYIRGSPSPEQRLKRLTVRLDLSRLNDANIKFSQLHHILVDYDNIGEGEDWTEDVPFEIAGFEPGSP